MARYQAQFELTFFSESSCFLEFRFIFNFFEISQRIIIQFFISIDMFDNHRLIALLHKLFFSLSTLDDFVHGFCFVNEYQFSFVYVGHRRSIYFLLQFDERFASQCGMFLKDNQRIWRFIRCIIQFPNGCSRLFTLDEINWVQLSARCVIAFTVNN